MEDIKSFNNLLAWQASYKLALLAYRSTNNFPANERFGLESQIKKSIVSINSNIAEGFTRNSLKDKLLFLNLAAESCRELESQLLLAKGMGYLGKDDFQIIIKQLTGARQQIYGQIRILKRKQKVPLLAGSARPVPLLDNQG